MNLDCEKVILRHCLCNRGGCLAHAESNFQNSRGFASKNRVKIEWHRLKWNAKSRQQCFAGTLLRCGVSALAQHETADRTSERRHARLCHRIRFHLESPRGSSIFSLPLKVVYSIESVSASFHFASA